MPLHFRIKLCQTSVNFVYCEQTACPTWVVFSHWGFGTINAALFKKTQLRHNNPWWNLAFSSQFFCATLDHITMTHSTGCWTEYHTIPVICSLPRVFRLSDICRRRYVTNITPSMLEATQNAGKEWLLKEPKSNFFVFHKTVSMRVPIVARSSYYFHHICPSVCVNQRGSHRTDFSEIWCWNFLKVSWGNSDLVKIGHKYRALYMKN